MSRMATAFGVGEPAGRADSGVRRTAVFVPGEHDVNDFLARRQIISLIRALCSNQAAGLVSFSFPALICSALAFAYV